MTVRHLSHPPDPAVPDGTDPDPDSAAKDPAAEAKTKTRKQRDLLEFKENAPRREISRTPEGGGVRSAALKKRGPG